MEQLGFTGFDIAATVLVGLSALMAFGRGLIRELFSIIAFIVGLVAALFFALSLAPTVQGFTGLNMMLSAIAAGMVIFLVVFIAITLVTSTLAKSAHKSTELGSFDRAAGLAFGALRGVLVVAAFVLVMRQTQANPDAPPANPFQESVQGARTYPIYLSTAKGLEAVLKVVWPRLGEGARDILNHGQTESATIPPAPEGSPPAEPAPPAEAPN